MISQGLVTCVVDGLADRMTSIFTVLAYSM